MGIAANRIIPDRTLFIGRRRERELAARELEEGTRLLTFTGPSGMGKTRLARKVMGEAASGFGDGGAWFCNLTTCTSALDLQAVVGSTLGISLSEGRGLALALANRGRTLLVLDNLDAIAAEATPILEDWLDHSDELQILITSILPVGMEGEVRFELGPLEKSEAVSLYLERANHAWAGAGAPELEREAVEELVGRLDRIPLAIELAAARVRVLSPRALLSRMSDRFDLLTSSRPGRHGSLLGALSLTWSLLSEEEKLALRKASVFPGSFGLEAAEALLTPGEPQRALELLDGLRSKALLQLEEADPPRFSLFETMAEYARMELERTGLEEEAVAAHAAHFVEQGEYYSSRSRGREEHQAIRWLQLERANLQAAQRRLVAKDPDLSARAGLALSELLSIQGGPIDEERIRLTMEAAKAAKDPLLLPRAFYARAFALHRQGRLEEARAAVDEGLQLARSLGARLAEGRLLWISAALWLRTAAFDRAVVDLDASIEACEEVEAWIDLGNAHLLRSWMEMLRGDPPASVEFNERAIAVFRQHGSRLFEALSLQAIGGVWANERQFSKARHVFSEAIVIFRDLEVPALEADTIANLAGVELMSGRIEEAEAYVREALALERRLGNRRFEGVCLYLLGVITYERDDPRQAEQLLVEASELLKESGDQRNRSHVLAFLAGCHAVTGRREEAVRALEEARSPFEGEGDPIAAAKVEIVEGLLDLRQERQSGASGPGASGRSEEAARQRLTAAIEASPATNLIYLKRMAERELRASPGESVKKSAPRSPEQLVVGMDGAWFELEGKRVSLHRRHALRRILRGLTALRLSSPGKGMSLEQVFEVGWEGENVQADAAASRVYVAIRTLRTLGLERILAREPEGYLLDPEVRVVQAPV